MKNYYTIGLCIFTTLSLFCCQKQEDPAARPFPRVRIIAVEETTESTLFTAEIFYADTPITDHGFTWHTATGSSSPYTESLGPANGKRTFSLITNDLSKDKEYTLRAYAANSQYRAYSAPITFTRKK